MGLEILKRNRRMDNFIGLDLTSRILTLNYRCNKAYHCHFYKYIKKNLSIVLDLLVKYLDVNISSILTFSSGKFLPYENRFRFLVFQSNLIFKNLYAWNLCSD